MPLYDFSCSRCGKVAERFIQGEYRPPECCGAVMGRVWSIEGMKIRQGTELWIERMEDIGKAQSARGERRTLVHPSQVL